MPRFYPGGMMAGKGLVPPKTSRATGGFGQFSLRLGGRGFEQPEIARNGTAAMRCQGWCQPIYLACFGWHFPTYFAKESTTLHSCGCEALSLAISSLSSIRAPIGFSRYGDTVSLMA